jgi:sialate O-acetylesterase
VKGGGTPDDFEIAGSNGRFQPAQAQVHGRTVIVSSPEVKHPEMVRFAWSDIAVPNLFNRRGWPALPFQWSVGSRP